MRLAVIDCGTNTFNLLILDVTADKKHQHVFSTRIPVRLGGSSTTSGVISDAAFQRGIDAIGNFHEEIQHHRVNHTVAIATSAIREATNGLAFVRKVAELYTISVEVIEGNREAELIYYGVREAVTMSEEVSLIMDIGGGSTEFILANSQQVFWKQSFKIGVARLLQLFAPSDPITVEQKNAIERYLNEALEPLYKAVIKFKPHELIGSSGAFESIVEMIHGELGGEALTAEKSEYVVRLLDNHAISHLAINSTLEQRKKIKGLVPMRFDMIVISCLTVNLILTSFGLNKLRVSTFSVKEGALLDYLLHQKKI
ncbi:MAG: phosphatase [bacterium]|nr:phosphatase [bacterium]